MTDDITYKLFADWTKIVLPREISGRELSDLIVAIGARKDSPLKIERERVGYEDVLAPENSHVGSSQSHFDRITLKKEDKWKPGCFVTGASAISCLMGLVAYGSGDGGLWVVSGIVGGVAGLTYLVGRDHVAKIEKLHPYKIYSEIELAENSTCTLGRFETHFKPALKDFVSLLYQEMRK